MSAFNTTPHAVTIIRPLASRDGATNIAKRDYDLGDGATARTIQGLFQVRPGQAAIGDAGELYNFDARFYTKDLLAAVGDLIQIPANFGVYASQFFLVLSAEFKQGLDGTFDHTELRLVKETRH